MKLFKHQEKFAHNYTGKRLIVHEGGTGKTVSACVWLRDGRDSDALVVCPKRVVEKWRETLVLWKARATVVSKENFKKMDHKQWSAVVIDEADEFASPLFTRSRSKLTEHMYGLLKNYPTQTLLLTATPIRSNPWNLHTLLTFTGRYIDWKKWRDYFFELKKMPYMPRPAWMPKNNWRKLVRPVLEKYGDIVLLKDCVGDVPPITEEIVKVAKDPFDPTAWEDTKLFVEEHRHEQKHKPEHILAIGKEFRKVLVVAHYREQCQDLYKQLSKDRETFMIMGGVKDQEAVIKSAQEADECFFIVQASLGAGFDANQFSCVVFASMSYAVRDYTQMRFRVRRIHDLKPVKFYYLMAGRCDKAVYRNIKLGKEFVPALWDATIKE